MELRFLYKNVELFDSILFWFALYVLKFSETMMYFCRTMDHIRKAVRAEDIVKQCPLLDTRSLSYINLKEREKYGLTSFIFQGFLRKCASRWKEGLSKHIPVGALYSITSSTDSGETVYQDETSFPIDLTSETEHDRANCLVLLLHESARSFSFDVQALDFVKTGPELAMAWAGVDVHAWHTRIAHQVAVYAMLDAAVQVETFLSQNRCNNPSPVHEILSERMYFLAESIESQLSSKNPKLVEWYNLVELPRIAGFFVSLFKTWSLDYAGSGVAGLILAISCCSAIRKLRLGRISSSFSVSVEHAVNELMTAADGLISISKYYNLATKAGFEEEFLCHFGRKILPNENIENLECWVELIEKKLSLAFDRECIFTNKPSVYDKDALAIIGLFAYLGRETRLFLARMNIKDIDEQTKDFLGHLECGGLLIYPEYSTLSQYQLFMEVVTDEIEWLDFYAAFDSKTDSAIKRPKHHATQAEKDMILYIAYTVCYDVISAFAHYTNSKQLPLSVLLFEFLLKSQNLLTACLEDFWAAYGGTGEWWKTAERGATFLLINGTTHSSVLPEQHQKPIDLIKGGRTRSEPKLHEVNSLDDMRPY
ncbi:secondary carrier transporter [Lithospermum erythrorhizon]|uniref:Secondary carrier transporter n=1 Tax=Lithospermum erythrorhizon TaxID=34254 RepID=A0AAV3QCS4_LITER